MKNITISIRLLLFMTFVTGFAYPGVVTMIAQAFFHDQADGSLIKNREGIVVGSKLIAQPFNNDKYFWPRPSAIDFNGMGSGGSNLGPTSKELVEKLQERKNKGFADDLLFASASGLDPHISPQAALSQISRVAQTRQMNEDKIRAIVNSHIEGRQLGFLGEQRVNVLTLNIALDERL